ncbi:MAG: hypothetical protein UZ19_OD1000027 [Parcubacteria bacterium OLB19]|nr:MAG: hypothetical protein UZ19_OD1000027 [Parcubacteria bacterium OLB19]
MSQYEPADPKLTERIKSILMQLSKATRRESFDLERFNQLVHQIFIKILGESLVSVLVRSVDGTRQSLYKINTVTEDVIFQGFS